MHIQAISLRVLVEQQVQVPLDEVFNEITNTSTSVMLPLTDLCFLKHIFPTRKNSFTFIRNYPLKNQAHKEEM